MPEEVDPMDAAEITNLKEKIRLLQERLAASEDDGVEPLSEHAARIVQSELGRLQHQLERVTDADRT